MDEEKFAEIQQTVATLAATWLQLAEKANDIAFARRRLYEAYILEGFMPQEALELCKGI
jgi:hypothetical protein